MNVTTTDQRGILTYTAIAFAVTWFLVAPIGLSHQGWIDAPVSEWWHPAGAAGPLLAALWVSSRYRTVTGLADGWRRWRVSPWLYLAALSPLLFAAPAGIIARLADGAWPDLRLLSEDEDFTGYGWLFMLLVPAVAYAIGEETGWRGFALPRLQARYGAWIGTLVLGVAWVIWHAPFYLYRAGMADTTAAEKVAQAVIIMIGGVFLTWLYNSSDGSILLVAIWHFTHSVIHIAIPAISIEWDTWIGVLSTILAITVAILWRHGLTTIPATGPDTSVPTTDKFTESELVQ